MNITALILAGGQGTRMGGADKGWVELDGRALIERLIEQLRPQVGRILISANRNIERYEALGAPVVKDLREGFHGPLAGIEAGLSWCRQHAPDDWLLSVPVDTVRLPPDYAQRMRASAPSVAVNDACLQPVFMLLPVSALPSLTTYLDEGQGRVSRWAKQQGLQCVNFEEAGSLGNLNDLQALQQAQQ